jgi:hypothetical protein
MRFPREKMSDDLHAVARLITQPEPSGAAAEKATAGRRWWTRLGARTSEA